MFVQNIIELSAAVHELSCVQRKKLRRKQYCPSPPRTVITASKCSPSARHWSMDALLTRCSVIRYA